MIKFLIWFGMLFRFVVFSSLMLVGGCFQLLGNFLVKSGHKLFLLTDEYFEMGE